MDSPSDRVITGATGATSAPRWLGVRADGVSAGPLLLALSALMLAFLPVVTLPMLSEYDEKRLAQLVLLAAAAACFAASGTLRRHTVAELAALPRSAWVAIALVVALGLASSLSAASPRHALAEIGLLGALALYSVTVAGALRPILHEARLWFIRAVLVMLILYLVHTAAAYLAWRTTVQMDVVELLTGLGSPRFVGHWLTLTLPLAVLPMFVLRSPWARAGALLVAVGWWAIAFGAGGRGTLLAALTAPFIVAVLVPRARQWFLVQLLCAALGLALAYVLFQLPTLASPAPSGLERLSNATGLTSSNHGRLVLLVESADLVLDHPVLGIGPMHFAAVGERGHPHNLVAQLATEWGLAATALMLALAAAAAASWWRLATAARDTHVLRPALAASLVGAAIHGMVSGILVPAYSQLWVAILAGFALREFNEMLAPYGREQERRAAAKQLASSGPARAAGAGLALTWVASLGAVFALVAVELPLVAQAKQAIHGRQVPYAPRFWQYGYIDESRNLQALVEGRPMRTRLRYSLEAALERADLPFGPE